MSLLVTIGFGKNQLVKGTHRDEKLTINFTWPYPWLARFISLAWKLFCYDIFSLCSESTTSQEWVRYVARTHLHATYKSMLFPTHTQPGCKRNKTCLTFTPTCRMSRLYREEYYFVPRTWVLPGEYNTLCYHIREQRRRHKIFIIKPHTGSMGNGWANYTFSTV